MLVRSYRTVSPLPVLSFQQEVEPSAVCFLWHFPASHLDWPLASTMPYGAPTFLNLVPEGTSLRSPGQLTVAREVSGHGTMRDRNTGL